MAFTVSNIVYSVRGRLENNSLLNKSNGITLAVDLTLISGASLVAVLLLAGILRLNLPVGVGTVGHYLGYGLIGIGGTITLADIMAVIVIKKCLTLENRYHNIDDSSPSKEISVNDTQKIQKNSNTLSYSLDAVIDRISQARNQGLRVALFVGRTTDQPMPQEDGWAWFSLDEAIKTGNNSCHLKINFNDTPVMKKIHHLFDKVVVDLGVIKFFHDSPWDYLHPLLFHQESSQLIVETDRGGHGHGESVLIDGREASIQVPDNDERKFYREEKSIFETWKDKVGPEQVDKEYSLFVQQRTKEDIEYEKRMYGNDDRLPLLFMRHILKREGLQPKKDDYRPRLLNAISGYLLTLFHHVELKKGYYPYRQDDDPVEYWAVSHPKSTEETNQDNGIYLGGENPYRNIIASAKEMNPSREEINQSKYVHCHQIINGLYLGNGESFARTTDFRCNVPNKNCIPEPIDTSNPLEFKTVITVCPLVDIFMDFTDLMAKSDEDFKASFEQRKMKWLHVGKMAIDDPVYWEALAYDCTYLDTELSKKTRTIKPMLETEFLSILQQKNQVISECPVKEWFEPVFREIDEAVYKGKKVLVHCRAGQSRSATLLAAYLIKRFNVSAAQAIAFLKSKRLCVRPEFVDGLNKYAKALRSAK